MQQQKVDGNSGFRVGVEFIEVDKDIVLMFINEKQRVDSQERKRAFEAERRRQQTRASEFGPY